MICFREIEQIIQSSLKMQLPKTFTIAMHSCTSKMVLKVISNWSNWLMLTQYIVSDYLLDTYSIQKSRQWLKSGKQTGIVSTIMESTVQWRSLATKKETKRYIIRNFDRWKRKPKKKKSGDEGVTTSDRKVRRDHFEKLYLRWEQKEIKGIFLYELEEKVALGKKKKKPVCV